MLSSRASKWKWYDWIFIAVVVIVVCVLIQVAIPDSGLAKALHTGFHAFALGLQWIAGGLISLAGLLNQL